MTKEFWLAVIGMVLTWGGIKVFLPHVQPTISSDSALSRNPTEHKPFLSPVIDRSPESRQTPLREQNISQSYELNTPHNKDGFRFKQIMEYSISKNLSHQSMGEIVQGIAEQLLGAQYKAGLLDQTQQETLYVSLTKFDCVLFVETVLALARGVAIQDYQYSNFSNRVADQRYWNGYRNGYCSRLHYFSEWINDNQRRGTVQNISHDLGGIPLKKSLNYISSHGKSYPRIANKTDDHGCILEMESNLKDITIFYIPQNQIKAIYPYLQAGDIVGIVTSIPGLDVTHTGLVYRTHQSNIGLIHASPIGKVSIASDLSRYVGNIKESMGIVVARLNDPRQPTVRSNPLN